METKNYTYLKNLLYLSFRDQRERLAEKQVWLSRIEQKFSQEENLDFLIKKLEKYIKSYRYTAFAGDFLNEFDQTLEDLGFVEYSFDEDPGLWSARGYFGTASDYGLKFYNDFLRRNAK